MTEQPSAKTPWGYWSTMAEGEVNDTKFVYRVKRLVVSPGQRTSMQSHSRRSERMICLSGTGMFYTEYQGHEGPPTLLGTALTPGSEASAHAGTKHRISNTCTTDLVLLEIQTGEVCEERDIKRYEDDYGRV